MALTCGGNEIAGRRLAISALATIMITPIVVHGSAKRGCLWMLAVSLLQMLNRSIYVCYASHVMPVLRFANSSFPE
jgi:hypothetical protein